MNHDCMKDVYTNLPQVQYLTSGREQQDRNSDTVGGVKDVCTPFSIIRSNGG